MAGSLWLSKTFLIKIAEPAWDMLSGWSAPRILQPYRLNFSLSDRWVSIISAVSIVLSCSKLYN